MLVGQRMNEAPVTITGDDLLSEAQAKMRRGGFRRLPVVSDGTLLGIVTHRDFKATCRSSRTNHSEWRHD